MVPIVIGTKTPRVDRQRVARCLSAVVVLALVGCSSSGARAVRPSAGTPATVRGVADTTAGSTAKASPSSAAVTAAPVTSTTRPRGVLAGKTVHIDAGHNGGNFSHTSEIDQPVNIITKTITCDTTGTEGGDGYTEAAFNLELAIRLEALLEARGAKVVMTRTTNTGWGPCINERAAIGNNAHADAAISIHADGNLSPGARGFHVIEPRVVPGYNDAIIGPSALLAADVRAAFPATGMPVSNYIGDDGIIARNDLGGLNFSKVPKIFVECGNMRNSTDLALLESSSWREQAAMALADAITRFLTPAA